MTRQSFLFPLRMRITGDKNPKFWFQIVLISKTVFSISHSIWCFYLVLRGFFLYARWLVSGLQSFEFVLLFLLGRSSYPLFSYKRLSVNLVITGSIIIIVIHITISISVYLHFFLFLLFILITPVLGSWLLRVQFHHNNFRISLYRVLFCCYWTEFGS